MGPLEWLDSLPGNLLALAFALWRYLDSERSPYQF